MNNTRKGISQVLFLIIAAAILMMVGMTLIFMFQGEAGQTEDASIQGCIASVDTMCSSIGGTNQLPAQCSDGAGNVYEQIQERDGVQGDQVVCQNWQ